MRQQRKQMSQSFTLIELLIVMVIISILSSLFMPALITVIAQGSTVSCLNNLKSIGSAHQLYINDHDDIVVPAEKKNLSNWSGPWVRWAGIFAHLEYITHPARPLQYEESGVWKDSPPLDKTSVLMCPSGLTDDFFSGSGSDFAKASRPTKDLLFSEKYWKKDRKVMPVWYGNNGSSAFNKTYPNWRVEPDTWKGTPLEFYDSRFNHILSPSLTASNFDGGGATNNSGHDLSRRHNNSTKINLLFWDGHSASVNSEEVPPVIFHWSTTDLNNWNPKIKWRTNQ